MLSVGNIFLPRISLIFTDLVTCYPCPFVASVGNVLFSHGFHRFSQIWLHVIRVHLCHQWEMFFSPTDFHRFARIWLHVIRVHLCHQWGMFFSPTDFTDFHRFGYMLSVSICVISGKCYFLPRISQICTDLVTCYPCPFVTSVGNVLFSHGFHRFSQIWLHVISVHLCHQWEISFSHGFHRFSQIWLNVIRAHLWHQWEYFFSHGFH